VTARELQEELEEANARIEHLERAVQGGLRWVDRLIRHCKVNGIPVTHTVLYGDNAIPSDTMKCTHTTPQAVNIYGGEGIEWCPDCGAFRRVSFKTAKSGNQMSADAWHTPKQVPECLVKSDITYR
jgi:hypothetical protein